MTSEAASTSSVVKRGESFCFWAATLPHFSQRRTRSLARVALLDFSGRARRQNLEHPDHCPETALNQNLGFSIGAMAHHQIVQAEFEPGVDKTLKADAL
jgi:hypothetical protein